MPMKLLNIPKNNQLPVIRPIDNQAVAGTPPEMAKKSQTTPFRLRKGQAKFTTLRRMVGDMYP